MSGKSFSVKHESPDNVVRLTASDRKGGESDSIRESSFCHSNIPSLLSSVSPLEEYQFELQFNLKNEVTDDNLYPTVGSIVESFPQLFDGSRKASESCLKSVSEVVESDEKRWMEKMRTVKLEGYVSNLGYEPTTAFDAYLKAIEDQRNGVNSDFDELQKLVLSPKGGFQGTGYDVIAMIYFARDIQAADKQKIQKVVCEVGYSQDLKLLVSSDAAYDDSQVIEELVERVMRSAESEQYYSVDTNAQVLFDLILEDHIAIDACRIVSVFLSQASEPNMSKKLQERFEYFAQKIRDIRPKLFTAEVWNDLVSGVVL